VGRAYDVLGPDVADDLARLLAAEDGNVRRAAYRSLANHRNVAVPLARSMIDDAALPADARASAVRMLAEVGERSDTEVVSKVAQGLDAALAAAAVRAIADRRWEAGPEMLRLLETTARRPQEEVVAEYFANHVIPGSEKPLLAALRRSRGALRKTYAEALETQTSKFEVGESPDAWARVLAEMEAAKK
jgi:hypothetical protein